ncbi:porin [Propionivibrio dicarboxylicus]|uniref:Outer membrane protein (Porin) n=1 Tax=Propionivibrio dicarboxylicus TaxID=83767 RepID=A0A1G8FMC5_9RHOO|nr:porin [Propionivibrio dicarboxylicus]SDH83146.1 Outer membrane protein (porin) [Propionivibrio dicarboxylicus]
MQKKVIALAVAALASGVAMAQSNITVYGIADVVGTSFNTNNAVAGNLKNQRGFDDGAVGSRIGFKGLEDLGGGLKAEFNYELGIAPTNNINQVGTTAAAGATLNNLSTRTAWVGLTSNDFGQISMGRFHALGWVFQAGSRPWGGIDPIRTMTNVQGISSNTSDRISNAIQYVSPTYAGFKVTGQYTADARANTSEQNTNDQTYVNGTAVGRQQIYLLGANYDQGPISAMAMYRHVAVPADLAGAAPTAAQRAKQEYGLRGAYDFGVAKVGAVYQRQQLKDAITINGGDYKTGYMYGGFVTVPFGAKFLATLEAAKSNGDRTQGGYGYMVNGQYLFSKRTSVYAQAGYMKMNQENASVTNLGSYGSTGIEAGKRMTGVMAGILHTF